MAKDDAKKVAPEAREIPIEGSDDKNEGAAAASGSAPQAESAKAQDAESAAAEKAPEGAAEKAEDADIAAEADAVVEQAERLAKAEQEAAALRDKYLRLQADWDNYRKRTAAETDEMRARAAEKLMNDVLPVLDDFERAIAHAEKNGEAGLLDGVKAISTKLNGVFAKHGLEAIDPAGKAFDSLEHQAVATVDDASVPDETVAQVFQKGYRLGKKVLRPAMVTLATGGPKREPEPAEGDKQE